MAQWRAYHAFWHADVVKMNKPMSITIHCEILKKNLIILCCIFNSSYCVNESFEDITFPGYPRTVWKRDLNAETRFPSPLVNSDLGMVYFEFNPRRKTEMDFFSFTFTIKMSTQGFYKNINNWYSW